jgi:hypothetical protein
MKKQNTLAFLVRNLEAWPSSVLRAPIIDGYRWVRGDGNLFLFDDYIVDDTIDMKITLHDWKVACLDSAAERTVAETKQDAIAKSFIIGIKSGDIDIQPVVDAMSEKAFSWNVSNGKCPIIVNYTDKPKQKIFISGPMSTHSDFNRPAFNSTSDALSLAGYVVLNPAILPDGLTQAQYMQIDLTMLQCCDAIFMLNNWDDSAGAMAEHALAMKLGLTVIHEVDLCQE